MRLADEIEGLQVRLDAARQEMAQVRTIRADGISLDLVRRAAGRCRGPPAAVTDLAMMKTRRRRVPGGLINEYERAA